MREYAVRWAVAALVVTPMMLLGVPLVDRLLDALPGAHANDSIWTDFLSMIGFYGGYALIAATAASLAHTWLVRRFRMTGRAKEITSGVVLGALVLIPQGLAFGGGYLGVNLAAGAAAGGVFGVLVTLRRRSPLEQTTVGRPQS